MRVLFYIIISVSMCSCGFVRYMNMDPVSDASVEQVNAYVQDNNWSHFDYSLMGLDKKLDSLSHLPHAMNLHKLERGTSASPIQARIYKGGKLVNGYAQCYGNYNRLNIFGKKDFVLRSYLPTNFDLLLSDEYMLWDADENTKQEIRLRSDEHDYTIIVYWNIWSNYYSKVMLKNLDKYLEKYEDPDHQILTVLVSTDRDSRKEDQTSDSVVTD